MKNRIPMGTWRLGAQVPELRAGGCRLLQFLQAVPDMQIHFGPIVQPRTAHMLFIQPKVSFRDGRFYIFDGQNTVEARRTSNGGMELPIRCKVFYGLTKEDEATLFAIRTGNATCLTAGERLRANLVAENQQRIGKAGKRASRLNTGR